MDNAEFSKYSVPQDYAIYREMKSNPVTQNHFLAMNQSKCVRMVDI